MLPAHLIVAARLAAAPAAAPAPAGPPLSLQDVVGAAVRTSTVVSGAQADLAGTRAKVADARSHVLPSLSVGTTFAHVGSFDPTISGLLSAIPGFSPNIAATNLQASQVLFDGFRARDGFLAADAYSAAADDGLVQARQQAAFDAATAYLTVLRTEALETNARQALRQAQGHLDVANLGERHGTGTHFDVLQAQTQVASVHDGLIRAHDGVLLARLALGSAIHQDLGDRPLAPLPPVPSVAIGAQDVDPSLARRPEFNQLASKRAADQHLLDVARDGYWPTVGLLGLYSQLGWGNSRLWVAGLSANWDLFNGGRTEAAVANAEATVAGDDAQLAGLRDGVRLEIQKAAGERLLAQQRVGVARQGLVTAKAGYDLAVLRFQQGVSTGFEEVDAETMLTGAQNAFIQATYDLAAAELKLDKAIGVDLVQLLAPGS